MGGKRRRHNPKRSVAERIWATLLVLGFLSLIVGTALYYSGPEILKWIEGLSGETPSRSAH